MFRISSLLCLVFMISMGLVLAQNEPIVGPHVEWEGVVYPTIQVDAVPQNLLIELIKDRECVTVYSPAQDRDYGITIKTPHGTINAARPHSQGFQGRFCYNVVGDDQILHVHVWLGKTAFKAVDGSEHTIEAERVVDFILSKNGQMRLVGESELQKTPTTSAVIAEDYKRFKPVYPTPVPMKSVVVENPEEKEKPKTEEQPVPTKEPKEKSQATKVEEQPAQIGNTVAEHKSSVPILAPAPDKLTQTSPTNTRSSVAEKIGAVTKDETSAKKTCFRYYEFELDHSKDSKIRIDGWLGFQRTREEGTIRFDSETNGARGTEVKIGTDLGVEDRDSSVVGGIDMYASGLHVSFDASTAHFKGSNTVPSGGGYRFGDVVFVPGSILDSSFQHRWYRGSLGYTAYLDRNFGIGFDFYGEYWRLDASIKGQNVPGRVKAEFGNFIPSLGMHVDWCPNDDRWLLTLGTHGTWFDIHDTKIWLVNVESWIRFFPCQYTYLFLRGEWEIADYVLDDAQDVDVNLDLYSTWNAAAGIGIRF